MRTATQAVLALLCCAALAAQAEPAKPAPSPGLAAVRALKAQYDAELKTYLAELKKLTTSPAYQEALKGKNEAKVAELRKGSGIHPIDGEGYAKRALEQAAALTGDERVPLLSQAVLWSANTATGKAAFAQLRSDFIGSAQLTQLLENGGNLGRQLGAQEAADFLEAVIADNKAALPRAWAMYLRSQQLGGKSASDADRERATKLLAEAEALAAGSPLADRIAGPRFEKERLQIGMTAPNIEGVDTDGTAFQLSDYRGKVVVLDFWGFW